MADVIILSTGRLYEAHMLADALQQEGLPHYLREANIAGLEFAMPALPAPGPGTFFKVIVPELAAADAREVLDSLPIEPESPGVWSFSPRPWARKVTIVAAGVILATFAISFAFQAARLF